MTPILRKILFFALQFLPLFLVFMWIYMQVMPYYQPVALGTANAVTERMSPSTRIEASPSLRMKSYVFTPEKGRRFLRSWGKTSVHLVFLSLALVPALMLATPAPIPARFRLLGVGLLMVFLGHVLALIVMTRGIHALHETPGTLYWLLAVRIAYASGQVVSATVGVLLTWRYWVPRRGEAGKVVS